MRESRHGKTTAERTKKSEKCGKFKLCKNVEHWSVKKTKLFCCHGIVSLQKLCLAKSLLATQRKEIIREIDGRKPLSLWQKPMFFKTFLV
jgi:hypothetical protein